MNNEVLPRESKNVAVIMTSGAVDLDRRMLSDRQWTVSLIERDLTFMQEQCTYYNAQILKSTEVGLVANFNDPAAAVKCALDIQKTLTRAAATMQPRDVLAHTIGIHLGDLVISGAEISGSSIAISHQLQLDANWGTIHISENIFDRANSALDLTTNYTTNYLGERYLQKIYQVIPKGFSSSIPVINPLDIDIDTIEIIDESGTEYVEPSMHIFDAVVNGLETNENIIEIKQLLLYICLNKWESDRSKLEKLNLKGLIQELLELTGTNHKLKSLIVETTQTVDGDYGLIGEIIINEISKLSPKSEPQDVYEEVVQSLEDINKDPIRIKKFLFYLCRYDLSNLDTKGLSLNQAIRELQNLYPTLEVLRNRMKQALTVINKPEYAAIMEVLIDELSAIYPMRSLNYNQNTFLESLPALLSNQLSNQLSPNLVAATVEPNQLEANSPKTVNGKSDKSIDAEIANLDLFDLRLNIIKYLSPLRVKILIFSTLNNVAESTNDSISAIRTYELDDLLRDLFYAYKSPEKLETQIVNTAKQFKDVDEYQQAANVIMSAVKPIYRILGIEV
jgi:adenylate cyclase